MHLLWYRTAMARADKKIEKPQVNGSRPLAV